MLETQSFAATVVELGETMRVLEARLRGTPRVEWAKVRPHLRFIRAIIGQLGTLEDLSGEDWRLIAPRLFFHMQVLAGASSAIQFIAGSDRLRRELMKTALAHDVLRIFVQGRPAGAPPRPVAKGRLRTTLSTPPGMRGWFGRGPGAPLNIPIHSGDVEAEPKARRARKAVPAFHYVLKGRKASGRRIAAGCKARLHFKYAVPGTDAIGAIRSAALSAARQANIDIMLIATTKGKLRLDGSVTATARFENGALAAPVSFQLIADKEPGKGTVQVDYLVRGELVYQSEIRITVVKAATLDAREDKAGDTAKRLPASFLAQADAASDAPAQRIRLTLSWVNHSLAIHVLDWRGNDTEHDKIYESTRLGPALIESLLNTIHSDLANTYQHEDAWRDFHGFAVAGDAHTGAALAHAMEAVAVAGCRLDRALRQDADAGIIRALDYIEANAMPGCVMSISTGDIFLPWELLYPLHRSPNMNSEEKQADPVRPDRFWGARFAIETDMRGEGSLVGRRDEHLRHGPTVSMNLNPKIRANGAIAAAEPHEIHRNWLEKHKDNPALAGVQDSCDAIKSVLRTPRQVASLIYLYCHGSAPDVTRGTQATLQLDGVDCRVEPQDLARQPNFPGSPIIFLNSCRGGVSSPLVFNHFLQEFQRRGALGMIGTTFAVPVAFGASFGLEVINGYMHRAGSLSAEMLRLRRLHLDNGNPVPLFYSLQCHLDPPFPARTIG